jgi:hypothetical protein
MNPVYLPVYPFLILSVLFSCRQPPLPYTYSGDWAIESQLTGPGRSEAVAFLINDVAYLGTGWDGLYTHYNDFWKYNPVNGSWTQVASMPAGTERSSAIGFSINNKGYVGTGYDGTHYLNDFYQYDPISDSWTKKAPFAGSPSYEAIAFGIAHMGYAGTGFDGTTVQNDFYQYDPSLDSWTALGFNGNARYGAVAWVYDNQGYIVTGVNSGVMQTDFWVFDPTNKPTWTALRPVYNFSSDPYDDGYVTIARWNAAAFVAGNQAYICTGENSETGMYNSDSWEYDMTISNGTRIDLWLEKTPFEGPARTGAVGFSLNSENGGGGFLVTGRTSPGLAGASAELWQFFPSIPPNPNDN